MSDTLAMLQVCARHQHPEAFGGMEIPEPPEVTSDRLNRPWEVIPAGCNREGVVWEEQGIGHPEARGITADEAAASVGSAA